MSSMSYISAIERYHEYRESLGELLSSIVTGVADAAMLTDEVLQRSTLEQMVKHYPFVDMLYVLDIEGWQISANVRPGTDATTNDSGKGADRGQRPYFMLARANDGVVVTEPYFSAVLGNVCLSTAIRLRGVDRELAGYLVLDIDLIRAIEFLMGDAARRKYQPMFRSVYTLIVTGLFGVVAVMLGMAGIEGGHLLHALVTSGEMHYKPFTIIVYLTLALAIFDLGKTTLEEEVLMHKDIFRHSSTRRTITRFIAAILIAVSIESLLLMFKSALSDSELLIQSVWMMMAAVGLLVGLGCYVYLGAKAESVLLKMRRG